VADWDKEYEQIRTNPALLREMIVRDLSINDNAIMMEMATQPLKYAKWAYFEACAEEAVRRADAAHKEILAEVKNTIRSNGKISVAACDDLAIVDPRVVQAKTFLLDRETVSGLLKQVRIGSSQKKDMIQSINSRQRAEMEMER
jgi:hypothetical protein